MGCWRKCFGTMSSNLDIALPSERTSLDCGLKSRQIPPPPPFLFIPMILSCFCLFKLQKAFSVFHSCMSRLFSYAVWARVLELESCLLLIARQLLYGLITSGPAGKESKEEGHTGFFFLLQECHAASKLLLKVDPTVDWVLSVFVLKCRGFKLLCFRTRTVFPPSCWVSKPGAATEFCVCIRSLHDLMIF